MPLMGSVDCIQLKTEYPSFRICQQKPPKLRSKNKKDRKTKQNPLEYPRQVQLSKHIQLQDIHIMGIPKKSKKKEQKKYLK